MGLSSFNSNLYFIDGKEGQIIKYPYKGNLQWDSPEQWILEEEKDIKGSKSLFVDGGIWVLQQDNSIDRYYAGKLEKSLSIEIYPELKNPLKIWTSSSLPHLYLIEPSQKRIIILDKEGKVLKQFRSEKFENLKDFVILDKNIYILDGSSLYKIESPF